MAGTKPNQPCPYPQFGFRLCVEVPAQAISIVIFEAPETPPANRAKHSVELIALNYLELSSHLVGVVAICVLDILIYELKSKSRHAYKPTSLLSKPVQPLFVSAKVQFFCDLFRFSKSFFQEIFTMGYN